MARNITRLRFKIVWAMLAGAITVDKAEALQRTEGAINLTMACAAVGIELEN